MYKKIRSGILDLLFFFENILAFCMGYALRPFRLCAKWCFIGCVHASWAFGSKSILWMPFLYELGRVSLDRRGPLWVMRTIVPGVTMMLDIADKTQRNIYLTKLYEEGISRFTLDTLQEGDTFFDIGANVGYYTLLASSKVGSGLVVACEPERENYALLTKNIEQGGYSPAHCLPVAVGKEIGTMTLHISPTNRGGNTLLPSLQYKSGAHKYTREQMEDWYGAQNLEQKVEVTTVDQLVEKYAVSSVKILKIDVEGFELAVFEGMEKTLRNKIVKNIMCEVGNPQTRGEVIQLLKNYGYTAHSLDQQGNRTQELGRDILFSTD